MPTASYILFGLATVWCIAWVARASRGWIMPLLLMASGAVHWLLADQGYYRNVVSFPPPQMALLVPLIIGMVLLFALPGGRRWLLKADIKALTALHILRIPVEIVLHEAYLKGHVPKAMTFSGHNFDILTGSSAVFLVVWMAAGKGPGRRILLVWNLVGTVLLGIVVVTAVLSIPSSIQRLSFDQPNILVVSPPWILLPAMLVPAVLWGHAVALFQLFRSRTD